MSGREDGEVHPTSARTDAARAEFVTGLMAPHGADTIGGAR